MEGIQTTALAGESSGDQWRDALAGLEAMEALDQASILREAVEQFGSRGPSKDRSRRQKQLAQLARRNDELFDGLDDRYYACKEEFEVFATRYVIRNAEVFK